MVVKNPKNYLQSFFFFFFFLHQFYYGIITHKDTTGFGNEIFFICVYVCVFWTFPLQMIFALL